MNSFDMSKCRRCYRFCYLMYETPIILEIHSYSYIVVLLQILEPTSKIVLNANELTIEDVHFTRKTDTGIDGVFFCYSSVITIN